MKHVTAAEQELFARLLMDAGLDVVLGHQETLLTYLDALIATNSRLNLTRIATAESGVRLHLLDSLLALPEIQSSPEGALLDIGTGGGLPGVPLCVVGGRQGVLLDSVGKKARAVQDLLETAGVAHEVRASAERAEEHALDHPGRYAVVTARAVSELPALVELASALLMQGGRLVALKGAPTEQELDRGRRVAELVGMRESSERRIALPESGERRCIVTYEKWAKSKVRLPRRIGAAQNSPLA